MSSVSNFLVVLPIPELQDSDESASEACVAEGLDRTGDSFELGLVSLRKLFESAIEDSGLPLVLTSAGDNEEGLSIRLSDSTHGETVISIWPCFGIYDAAKGLTLAASSEEYDNSLIIRMVESHDRAMTVPQLAKLLHLSKRHIYKLVEDKRIPAIKIGTAIRLDSTAISEWLKRQMTIAA